MAMGSGGCHRCGAIPSAVDTVACSFRHGCSVGARGLGTVAQDVCVLRSTSSEMCEGSTFEASITARWDRSLALQCTLHGRRRQLMRLLHAWVCEETRKRGVLLATVGGAAWARRRMRIALITRAHNALSRHQSNKEEGAR